MRCDDGVMEIWHLALARDWDAAVAAGEYRVSTRGATLADVGFIHCSLPHQAPGVAARFYADVVEPLAILVMEDDAVRASGIDVRYEDAGEGELFPHLYGAIVPAVVRRMMAARVTDGQLVIQ